MSEYKRIIPVEYQIEVLPEDTDPIDHFATGCEIRDIELANQIRSDLEWNEWSWCIVKVTAKSFDGLAVGAACLGGCSYEDEAQFRSGLYFEDMKSEALEDLIGEINDQLSESRYMAIHKTSDQIEITNERTEIHQCK